MSNERTPKAHEEFYARLETITKRAGNDFKVLHEFNNPDLFVGASITLSVSKDGVGIIDHAA